MALADALPPEERRALVLAGEGWHQGVVGIVASRLTEQYACPAFMICLQDGKGNRAPAGPLGASTSLPRWSGCADLLEGYGGHEMAAGFTIAQEKIPAFRARMNRLVLEETGGAEMVSTLDIDAAIPELSLLTLEEVEALDLLEPFGTGNPKPVFFLGGCTVSSAVEVGGGRHLKLRLTVGGRPFDASSSRPPWPERGGGGRRPRGHRVLPPDQRIPGVALGPAPDRGPAPCPYPGPERAGPLRALCAGGAHYPWGGGLSAAQPEEFVGLWRYLKERNGPAGVEETSRRLTRNLSRSFGRHAPLPRTMICLEVFDERGLIHLERSGEHLSIHIHPVGGKVNLEESGILRRLHQLMED